MTSGLRWPWWGILNRRGNRGRVTCKSSLSPLGAITQMFQIYTASFEVPVKRDTHIFRHAAAHKSGWRSRDPWQVKISCVRFPHDGPVNYWTKLVLLIHALVCTQRLSHLSDTPLHTHTWLRGFLFFFFFTCFCNWSRWDSLWHASVHLLFFFVFLFVFFLTVRLQHVCLLRR